MADVDPDIDEDGFKSLCLAVGFIVVNWALLEQALDQCVAVIYHSVGGKRISREIPRSLSNKNTFLKRAFKTLPALTEFRKEGLNILEGAMEASEMRHGLVHGVITHMKPIDGGYTFARFKYKKEAHVLTNFRFDGKDFPPLVEKLQDLGKRAAVLGNTLADRYRTK